ncbi:5-hydroxytryptamine (serotonin) receptor 1A b [Hoplias malabaricus]|uniref:5-hydroxytryptamine (serotonin) receptor 1A b n=1 Tax=Hoplias malabaricus TaxID=27720 RepID=UPI00346210A1
MEDAQNLSSLFPNDSAVYERNDTANDTGARAQVPLSYQVSTSLLIGALILCSVFGNACVVAAIALERSLQNVANYLIGSLAVTDLMVSVLVLPMACLYQVLDRWTLGQVACDIFISLDVLCCTSSILHLCAIALDRYWAITDPIDYMKKRTMKRAAVLISVTWLVGFSISVPPMLIMKSSPASKAEESANPEACAISHDPWYTIYSTFGAFYIPLTLMLVLYGRIFRAARFRIRKTVRKSEKVECLSAVSPALSKKTNGELKTWRSSAQPQKKSVESKRDACANGAAKRADLGSGVGVGECVEIVEVHGGKSTLPLPNAPGHVPLFEHRHEKNTEAKRKLALARERKTVKTLGIIMGTFILCWLPFFIKALVMPFCPSCHMPVWLSDVINWLGYSNSLLNPIIYAYFNKDFQSAFKKIIKCHFCRP